MMENFKTGTENNDQSENYKYDRKYVKPIDPYNPFDNPTENPSYNDDYRDIVPQISIEGCEIPPIPGKAEKKRIRYFYNLAGGGIIFHIVVSVILANIMNFIAVTVLMLINGMSYSDTFTGGANMITDYINNSSISSGILLLCYLISNLLTFFIGCKISKIEIKSLFKTDKLTVPLAIQYILACLFLQRLAGMAIAFLGQLFPQADLIGSSEIVQYTSVKALIISLLYSCIVAPITEEFLYRGFIMKTFSKVSQRFGIFASAFFFGIMHGNAAQFVLAFTVGVFMGYIDVKHNSLVPSICVHLAINITAAASGLVVNYASNGSPAVIISNLIFFALFVAGLVMFITFCRKNRIPQSSIQQRYRSTAVALTSPAVVIAAAIYFILFISTTVQ